MGSMFFWKKKQAPNEEFVDLREASKDKLTVRFFKLMQENDIENIKAAIADGKTIIMLNIGYFGNKDQLKKCLSDIKQATSTFEGDIIALNPGLLLITPKSISIEGRNPKKQEGGEIYGQ
ncbi:MAG TPA: cell division protein SepF [Candidatus Nanoarchaeia archaeon]|nr:cell division protein SepF [Candidatus Nanoarchaeia archaeon]